jgi:transposase-like protein
MSTPKQSGRHGPRRVTTDAEIIALRRQGWTTPNICRELRVGHPRVRRALAGLDIAPPTPARRGIQRTEKRLAIIRLADGTHTVSEIVSEVGVSASLVRRVAAQEGLPILVDRRGPAPKAKAPKPSKTAPSLAQPRSRPARPERIQPAASPKAPRTASDISPKSTAPTQITTRTCHACELTMPESEWAGHRAKVHKVVSKGHAQMTALDRYIAQLQPEGEPARPIEPPCEICGQSPCPTSLICARHARARKQHGWSGKKAA